MINSNYLVVIWVILALVISCTTITILIIWANKKKYTAKNKNGFMCLEINVDKNRIKHLNNIADVNNEPFFLKKLNLLNNRWKKIEDFQKLLDKKSNFLISNSLKNKENSIISFEKQPHKFSAWKTKINMEIVFVSSNVAYLTINWNEINNKEEEVFEPINNNISFLLDQNSKYKACGFILNYKNLNNVNNFINLFKSCCLKIKARGIKVFLDWNKLFFVFPYSKFKKKSIIKAVDAIQDNSKHFGYLYETFFTFENTLLTNKSNYSYELIFDYIKTHSLNHLDISTIDFENNKDLKLFKEKYEYVTDEILRSNNIDLKNFSFNDFGDKNSKLSMLLIDKKFDELNIDNRDVLTTLDIYKNYYLKFYENSNIINLHGKILNIEDFIFGLVDNKFIKQVITSDKSLFHLININSKKSMLRVKKKIEQIQEESPKASIGIKVYKINDDIINEIGEWSKIIWLDKNLTNSLNEPKTMLYVNLLMKKAEQLKISLIFEKLDFKNYKKMLYNNNLKLFYTIDKNQNKTKKER